MAEDNEHDPKKENNELRSIDEILYVHDVVDQFISGMLPIKPDTGDASIWTGIQLALCWVLNHKFGNKLTLNVENIVNKCIEIGHLLYVLPDDGGNGKGPKPVVPGSIIKK